MLSFTKSRSSGLNLGQITPKVEKYLADQQTSPENFPFLKTGYNINSSVKSGEYFLIDIGGTYIKFARAQITLNKGLPKVHLTDLDKVSINYFLNSERNSLTTLLTNIVNYLPKEWSECENLSIAFSFPFIPKPGFDGECIAGYYEKSDLEFENNVLIGETLQSLFTKRFDKEIKINIINDVAALLLSGLTQTNKANLSLIVGTAFNIGYSISTNTYNSEIGGLDLDGVEIQEYIGGKFIGDKLKGEFINSPYLVDDMIDILSPEKYPGQIQLRIGQLLEQSAKITARVILGFAKHLNQNDLKIIADGSVFWGTPNYVQNVQNEVAKIDSQIKLAFQRVENATLVGTAIAGAIAA